MSSHTALIPAVGYVESGQLAPVGQISGVNVFASQRDMVKISTCLTEF